MKNIQKGRGAVSNREGRFESLHLSPFDDGWGTLQAEPQTKIKTRVEQDLTRSIITKNTSPDIPFEQSVNPYKGCEHGCIYCYARQSHSFLGLSPGLDFETRLFQKKDAPQLLEKAFESRRYQCKTITIGSNTDPYQPIERQYAITRKLLEVMVQWRHPAVIITKSALILRDLDLLTDLARDNLILVMVSVTTLCPDLASKMEPRAAAPHRRIEVIKALSQAGIRVGVSAAPMIPALNDMEMEKILELGAGAGAQTAAYILIRLPNEVRDLFLEWLNTHYPGKAEHVMNLIREMREGQDYRSRFGERMRGRGVYAQLMSRRFKVAARRFNLNHRIYDLDTHHFKRPPRAGDQLSLFEE